MTYHINDDQPACFNRAIQAGILSSNPDAENFAGNYMYMFSDYDPLGGYPRDHFKHHETRRYVHNLQTGYVTIS